MDEHLKDLDGLELAACRLMVVDDRPQNVDAVVDILVAQGYGSVEGYTDSREAIKALENGKAIDLLLLDLHMPGIDGIEFLARMQTVVPRGEFVPVIVLTGDSGPDQRERALALGALDYILKPFRKTEVLLRTRNLLRTRALHQQLRHHASELEARVQDRTEDLNTAHLDTINRLARAAEFRDDDTGFHTKRVGDMAGALAIAMGKSEDFADQLCHAAKLHDIGKIGVPDSILLKPGKLTPGELELIKTHTTIGMRILEGSPSALVQLAAQVAESHHERWDGTGYPNQFAGETIPVSGRITAVADVFDALTHDRPYKKAWPVDVAIEEIRSQSGRQFDPTVVTAFLTIIGNGASGTKPGAGEA